MALSIAIVKCRNEVDIYLGGWDTLEEAKFSLEDSGSDEQVIALEKFDGDDRSSNREILEAMAENAGYEFSIGRDLERLLNFAFQLGRKVER